MNDRITITATIYELDTDDIMPDLDDLISSLQDARCAEGYRNIRLESEEDHEYCDNCDNKGRVTWKVVGDRLENDYEYQHRKARERQTEEHVARIEKRDIERARTLLTQKGYAVLPGESV